MVDSPEDRSGSLVEPAVHLLTGRSPVLIFDGDCAFCTRSVDWLARCLRRGDRTDPEILPWQQVDLEALALDADQVKREVVWIDAADQRYGGSAALAQWLRHRGSWYGLVGRIIDAVAVRQVAAVVYRLVAMNRHRLPGGSSSCVLPRP